MIAVAHGRGWRYKFLRLDGRGNCRGYCRGLSGTAVVFAAHRMSSVTMAHGPGWRGSLMRLDAFGNCRGHCRGFPQISVGVAAHRMIAVAMAVDSSTAADGLVNCSTSEETAVAIAADFRGDCRLSDDCRCNDRG